MVQRNVTMEQQWQNGNGKVETRLTSKHFDITLTKTAGEAWQHTWKTELLHCFEG